MPGQPPRTLASAVWNPLKDLVSQKGAWGFLALVLLYKAGDAFALSLYSAFMIKGVGFSLAELSIAGKANMTVSTIAGVTLGGWIYMRWGMFRSLLVFGIGQSLTNLLYTVLALSGKKLWLMALATTLDTGIGGMGRLRMWDFSCRCAVRAQRHAVRAALRHGIHSTQRHRSHCRYAGLSHWLAEIFCGDLPDGGTRPHLVGDFAPSIAGTLRARTLAPNVRRRQEPARQN